LNIIIYRNLQASVQSALLKQKVDKIKDPECTFSPKIKKGTMPLSAYTKDKDSSSVFSSLYEQATISLATKQELFKKGADKECTFNPKVW
jgi:hypothetical protein